MAMNYVPYAEGVMDLTVDLYRSTAKVPTVIQGHVLQNIIKVGSLYTDSERNCCQYIIVCLVFGKCLFVRGGGWAGEWRWGVGD